MNLKSVGFYREMLQGKETDPSIHDVVRKGDPALIENICNYLRKGTLVILSPGVTMDIFDEKTSISGTGSAYTDGIWLWPDDLAYYVHKYNIALPDDFIKTMKNNNWKNPSYDIDLSIEEITVDDIEL
ncbi:MAG: hypothetical protein IJ523_10895 [Succinivibrionaceae bacterium]|nr:hypothetical protein [Succinivibrionaceae bacterium]